MNQNSELKEKYNNQITSMDLLANEQYAIIGQKDKQIQSLERIIKELKEHEDIYVQQMQKLETDIKALKEDSLKER